MSWLWGGSNSSKAKDALDPSLRDFLDKETRKGPKPSLPSVPPPPQADQAAPIAHPEGRAEAPKVPAESQFQDGRYAHLWKNYVPQNQLVDRSKSDQDKLRDIVDTYNDRKAEVGRAAMENCAFEYMEQWECYGNPNFKQTMTLCADETRKFSRCVEIQKKFLNALGYMTMDDRSPEQSEIIQMHADKLYQQYKEQEKLIDEARKAGRPIPRFEPVISKKSVEKTLGKEQEDLYDQVKPETRAEYEKRLAEMTPEQQALERNALEGELRAEKTMALKVNQAFIEERIGRMKRKETGQTTIGDRIKTWWGWDDQ